MGHVCAPSKRGQGPEKQRVSRNPGDTKPRISCKGASNTPVHDPLFLLNTSMMEYTSNLREEFLLEPRHQSHPLLHHNAPELR